MHFISQQEQAASRDPILRVQDSHPWLTNNDEMMNHSTSINI